MFLLWMSAAAAAGAFAVVGLVVLLFTDSEISVWTWVIIAYLILSSVLMCAYQLHVRRKRAVSDDDETTTSA